MRAVKMILGGFCFTVAIFLLFIALAIFRWGPLWFTCLIILFCIVISLAGVRFCTEPHLPMPKKSQAFVISWFAVFITTIIILGVRFHYERKELQARARAFLIRPIPSLLVPDADGNVGGYHVDPAAGPPNGVFGYSRVLIARYAIHRRIRWSAKIQEEFSGIGDGLNGNIRSDEITTNREVKTYLAERNAILGREWNMGFWQGMEDMLDFNNNPLEIQEEDESHKFVSLCEGSWTNARPDTLTIQPDCTFSFEQSDRQTTNIYTGDWVIGVGTPSLELIFTQTAERNPIWSPGEVATLYVIHTDEHTLVYKIGNETNRMTR
jgi:hypothetical protein